MDEQIAINQSPEKNVFGLIGSNALTDKGKFYIKKSDDSRNIGWEEIIQLPTSTPTVTPTQTKTPYPTRTPRVSGTPGATPTRTPTPTPTPPTVTTTPITSIQYTITSTTGGSAARTDGPTPTGTISIGTGIINIIASISPGYYFAGWSVNSAGVGISNIYSLETTAFGFNTTQNVIITANFLPGTLPTYWINGVLGSRGVINFNYIDAYGIENNYAEMLGSAGETVSHLICGNRVTVNFLGSAYITNTPCNLPTQTPPPTGILPPTSTPIPGTATPTPTPSSILPTPTPSTVPPTPTPTPVPPTPTPSGTDPTPTPSGTDPTPTPTTSPTPTSTPTAIPPTPTPTSTPTDIPPTPTEPDPTPTPSPTPTQVCSLYQANADLGSVTVWCCSGVATVVVNAGDIYCLAGSGGLSGWTLISTGCSGCFIN
jgi:hypothetical protein